MNHPMAEDLYDAAEAAAQAAYEQHELAEYLIDSAAWDSVRIEEAIVVSEGVTLEHLSNLKKIGKLDRRMKRMAKKLAREQTEWHELE